MEKEGEYYAIMNRFTKHIIVAGKIINRKEIPIKCISFDNKYFFNTGFNLFYKVIKVADGTELAFDDKKYKITLWRNASLYKHRLVYREYTKDELDEEIADLVYILNKIGYTTVGSCCGHGLRTAWIDIKFDSLESLRKLNSIIKSDKFIHKFMFISNSNVSNCDHGIIISLATQEIGKAAYKAIDELVSYLKIYDEAMN